MPLGVDSDNAGRLPDEANGCNVPANSFTPGGV